MCQRIAWHIYWWRWFWKPEVPNLWVGFPPKRHKRNLGGCKMIEKKSRMSRSHWSIQSLEGCYSLWMVPCVEAKRCPESQRDIKGAQQQYRAKLRKARLVRQQGESQCTPFNAHRNRNTELFILRDWWESLPAQIHDRNASPASSHSGNKLNMNNFPKCSMAATSAHICPVRAEKLDKATASREARDSMLLRFCMFEPLT